MKRTILICILLVSAGVAAREMGVFAVLNSKTLIGKQANGIYLLPTSQLLDPWGEPMTFPGRPVDIAWDSRKYLLAVLNSSSVLLVDGRTSALVASVKSRTTSYGGVAFRPDDRELWASEATREGPDSILVTELSDLGRPGQTTHIELPGHPTPVGIAFSRDGSKAFAAFSRNNSVGVIDVRTKKLVEEIPVGIAPFAVLLSAAGRLYVSNRGGRRSAAGDTTADSSGSQVVTDPFTGAAVSGTISVIDEKTHAVKEVAVGLAPSGMALSPDEKILAIANGHSDSVSLLDTATLDKTDIKIPAYPEGVSGSQPIAVTFAPGGRKFYVACGGTNSLAVIQADDKRREKWTVVGALPTAWFPSAIAIDPAGALRVVNIKGVGNTANGHGTFHSVAYEGVLEKIAAPGAAQIVAGTEAVKAANSPKLEPAGGISNLHSLGIEHVFLVIKENRTYDQVFGDIAKGNGDPKLVFYGGDTTPNQHALAERYVLLDNFYAGGAVSVDGHQWLMQGFVSDYVERSFGDYPRGYPGNMGDALAVAPVGFFWQFSPKPVSVRVWGQFCTPGHWDPTSQTVTALKPSQILSWSEYWNRYREGKWQEVTGCYPTVPALAKFTSPSYPNNNLFITDQIRAEEFLREFAEKEKRGDLANINIITLPDDHTNGTSPASPTPRAMVADNDLALGRIVEAISTSRYWPKSLILVVEDDAADGVDHVDGHRTTALVIGPNVRLDVVDSNNYTHLSMVRTVQEIFRIPPRTRFLAAARAMTSVFTATPDLTPYHKLIPKVALDEMNPPLRALAGRERLAAQQSAAMNWLDVDDVPQKVLNRILWGNAKGFYKPYPADKRTR